MEYRKLRVIISGGGTGGHIFPAVSIACKLKEVNPETEILFVGAEGKMEMEKVPAAGFEIVGLPIVGLQRQLNWHNIVNDIKVPFKIISSICKAGKIIDSFQPDVAVGVGGYASAPLLWKACSKGIPSLIQEQNGFAGLTNKLLAKRVDRICVAYEGMERFFPSDRIIMSGNPIRDIIHPYSDEEKAEGIAHYGLDPAKRHLLVTGGSLGSGTLNRAMKSWISDGCPGAEGIDVIWQCGSYYKPEIDAFIAKHPCPAVHHFDFLKRMDLAFAAADLIISRSGASSVSEICAAGKAAIFVPSPNVAEDHQTHNAMALVNKGAAMIVRDADAVQLLMKTATETVKDSEKLAAIEREAYKLAKADAAQTIVDEIYKIAR